jgi:rhodanese-related sulfurtransferase
MSAIDDAVDAARSTLDRADPGEAQRLQSEGALIVDIRPHANRLAEGEIPGAIPIERIHLEWRLDPTSDWKIPQANADVPVIIVCNEGYASSLAAADLQRLGLPHATDLIGGYRAWRASGLPTTPGATPAIP